MHIGRTDKILVSAPFHYAVFTRSLLQWWRRNPCGFPTVDDIQIRRLRPGDSLNEFTALLHRAFGSMSHLGLPCNCVHPPVEETICRIRRGTCFVAVRGSRIVGTMTLETPRWRRECSWYQRSDVASLHKIAVDPSEQGQGCGSRLLSFERWPRRLGHAELSLGILVVEDEAEIHHFVSLSLDREGFDVYQADGVQCGLIDAGTRWPDLVVLDLGFPEGDGVDLIKQLRTWSDIPVLVLSARIDEADKVRALHADADDYLIKPFGMGELLARVRAHLRRRAAGPPGRRVPTPWLNSAMCALTWRAALSFATTRTCT
jgi:CheY-like chemotaxis protein